MNYDKDDASRKNDANKDFFSEKNVDEQIEHFLMNQANSPQDPSATDIPENRLIQDLARLHLEQNDEMQQALQRAWQRIAASQPTHAINLPLKNQAQEEVPDRVTAPLQPIIVLHMIQKSPPSRHKPWPHYLSIATLVALLILVVGSTVLITRSLAYNQQIHPNPAVAHIATATAKPSATRQTTTTTRTAVTPAATQTAAQIPTQTPVPTPTMTPANIPGNAPPVSGNNTLLASDMFNGSGVLNGASEGTGWSHSWDVQNGDTSTPGYTIENSNPLGYNNLQSTDTYATGGSQYLTAGHTFDTSTNGPFASYLTNGVIGNSGTTLWVSILLRKETNDDQQAWVGLNNEQIDWCATCTTQAVNIGYFGSGSDAQGTRYWSLQLGGTVYRTSVPLVVGQTALLVLSINFGNTTQCQLYVDPNSLGGPAPGASNTQASIATDLVMQNLGYYGGDIPGNSSLAAIRVGTSYASVTPIS